MADTRPIEQRIAAMAVTYRRTRSVSDGEYHRSLAEDVRLAIAAARREERERCAALVAAAKNLVDAAWDSQDWDGTRVGDALDEVDAAIRALGEE